MEQNNPILYVPYLLGGCRNRSGVEFYKKMIANAIGPVTGGTLKDIITSLSCFDRQLKLEARGKIWRFQSNVFCHV